MHIVLVRVKGRELYIKNITNQVSKSISKDNVSYCIAFMHGFELYVGTQYVHILWCCMFLFFCVAYGTEAMEGAVYSNSTLTISQNTNKNSGKLTEWELIYTDTKHGN